MNGKALFNLIYKIMMMRESASRKPYRMEI